MLCKTNNLTFTFFQTMSLALNFCLCHDLIVTLKDPFYPGKRRMKFYLYGSFLISILISAISKSTLGEVCEANVQNKIIADKYRYLQFGGGAGSSLQDGSQAVDSDPIIKEGYYYTYVIGIIQLISFMLIALYSCVFAYRRLTRPGMSAEVRYVFIRKHIFYVGVFIVLWTFALAHSYFQIFYAAQDLSKLEEKERIARIAQYAEIDRIMMKITIYTSIFTGFLMSLIRAREPYFRFLIRKEFSSWFGILMDENDAKTSQ